MRVNTFSIGLASYLGALVTVSGVAVSLATFGVVVSSPAGASSRMLLTAVNNPVSPCIWDGSYQGHR